MNKNIILAGMILMHKLNYQVRALENKLRAILHKALL